jgi:predicted CoA-substrate-specific enzyme activase
LPEEASYDRADSLIWPAVCGYAKSVLQCLQGSGCDAVVFTDCCDAMKRVYDILSRDAACGPAAPGGSVQTYAAAPTDGFFPAHAGSSVTPFMIWLPRVINDSSVRAYARSIGSFIERYEAYCGRRFDIPAFLRACVRANEDKGSARDGEAFVALMGARAPVSLIKAARGLCSLPVRDFTCGSDERKFSGIPDVGPASGDCARMDESITGAALNLTGPECGARSCTDELLIWYAGELLAQTPCMRMNDNGARSALTDGADKGGLKAIVYHTIQFCDFYGFEYAQLSRDIPALKLETDYTPASSGQLVTRLQAFFESNGMLVANPGDRASRNVDLSYAGYGAGGRLCHKGKDGSPSAAPPSEGCGSESGDALQFNKNGGTDTMPQRYYAGVDSGSTSTNAVIVGDDAEIVAAATVPTGADSAAAAELALSDALDKAGLSEGEITAIVATGYGRVSVPFAARDVTEITCHARGAHWLVPGACTVIDIGGQDSKVIRLNPGGSVTEFSMNDKCAAGTGRFLELMADTLGMDIDEMARAGLRPGERVDISSMCAVFAESEVISLIAQGKSTEDIVWGVDLAIAGRVASMAARLGATAPYVMTGGVANNAGVVKALGEKLRERSGRSEDLTVPGDPQICGALGAALIARDLPANASASS